MNRDGTRKQKGRSLVGRKKHAKLHSVLLQALVLHESFTGIRNL